MLLNYTFEEPLSVFRVTFWKLEASLAVVRHCLPLNKTHADVICLS